MNELLSVAVAVIAGLVMTRLIKPLHLPDVTAYLLTGVAIGPYLLGSLGIEGLGFCSAENISATFVGDFASIITAGFALAVLPLKTHKSIGRLTCTE